MNDIIKRLRFQTGQHVPVIDTMAEAANEIVRLEVINAALLEALEQFIDQYLGLDDAYGLARAAIARAKGETP